jgi:hypothetical protein
VRTRHPKPAPAGILISRTVSDISCATCTPLYRAPWGLAVLPNGEVFVSDSQNNVVSGRCRLRFPPLRAMGCARSFAALGASGDRMRPAPAVRRRVISTGRSSAHSPCASGAQTCCAPRNDGDGWRQGMPGFPLREPSTGTPSHGARAHTHVRMR